MKLHTILRCSSLLIQKIEESSPNDLNYTTCQFRSPKAASGPS